VLEKLHNNPHLRAHTCKDHIPLTRKKQDKTTEKKVQSSAGNFYIPDTIKTFNFSKISVKVLRQP